MAALKGIYKLIGIFYIILASDSFGTVPLKGTTVPVSPAIPSPAPPSVKSLPAVPSPKLPEFSHASHGSISATTAVDGKSMTIKTGPSRNVGDFHSYNIARGHTVDVSQQSAGSKSVFRVGGEHPANIWGTMKVNQGDVYLTGPGFIFHEGSTVNASNLVAAAAKFSDASARNFANGGNLLFDIIPGGNIFSRGSIQIDDGGILGFIGANITEDGLIKGKKIQVNGIAGEKVWVEFDDNLINFRADGILDDASIDVSKSARIETEGGDVNLTLSGMDKVLRNSINVEGYVDAGGSSVDDAGNIVFDAGKGAIKINGEVLTKVTGKDKSTAGDIKVKAKKIDIGDTAVLDASGDYAAGRIEVGGTRLVIKDSPGPKGKPIAYADDVTISEGAMLLAQRNKGSGKAGQIFAIAKNNMDFKGTTNVEAWGKGNGGFIELSQLTGDFSLGGIKPEQVLFKNYGTGTAGQFLIDPDSLNISSTTVTSPSPIRVAASSIEEWLSLGTVFLEATEVINILAPVNVPSKHDLVIVSGYIGIAENITLSDYGNLILWITGSSNTPGMDSGKYISSDVSGRNFVVLSTPSGVAPNFSFSLSAAISPNIIKYGFSRDTTGGDAIELAPGTHYTADVTNATLPGSLASRSSFGIMGLKDASTVTEIRSSGLVDGTKVGVLNRASIGIADTDPLMDTMSTLNLIAYANMTRGDITGQGSIANSISASQYLSTKDLTYTVDSVTGAAGTGGIIGTNSGLIRSFNTQYEIGDVSGTTSTGGMVGIASGGSSQFFDKGTTTVASVTGSSGTGGIIGVNSGTISSAQNTSYGIGAVSGAGRTGGMIGEASGSNQFTGNNTITVASVTSSENTAGGLVGGLTSGSDLTLTGTGTGTITIGDITLTGTGKEAIGGLVGVMGDSTNFTINDGVTINSIGNISGGTYAGGLVGILYDSGGSTSFKINNPLSITSIGAIGDSSSSFVGGLIGNTNARDVNLLNLTVGTIGAISGINNVGGLIGRAEGNGNAVILSDLTIGTIGAISGTSNVGGLIGRAKDDGNNVSITDARISKITSVTGDEGNVNNVAGLVGLAENGLLKLSRLTIESLKASSVNLMIGNSSTTDITMKDSITLPNVNVGSFDSGHIVWDTLGTDESYGVIAGQLANLPTAIIPDATDIFFRFWKDNGADPITNFTQWQGKLASSLTSADAVSIDRATNGVMKLVFSEGDAVISPYQSIQILDTDSGTYSTYDIDTANPVVNGKTASSSYVINDSVTTAITEDPDTSTDIAPDSGAGYDYTAGTGWQGAIVINSEKDTIEIADPETRGFTYNGNLGVWETNDTEVEVSGVGLQTTDPTTVGYAYDPNGNSGAGAWVATVENIANVGNTTTTTTPVTEGFAWNNVSKSWEATIEGGGTTTPAAAGFSYNGTNWVASIEGGSSTAPAAAGFSYNGTNWVASIEGGTSTVPAADGYVYNSEGNVWEATIEDTNNLGSTKTTTTPAAEGFSYNGTNWVASIEGGTSTVPAADGYVYNSEGNVWEATVEDINNLGSTRNTATPAAEGFNYTDGSWKATIENVNNVGTTINTTTPTAEGFVWNSGSESWVASIEGGTTSTPAAAGYVYNSSNWVASVEDVNKLGWTTTTTTPGAEGFEYNGTSWEATVEGGVTTTPAAEGFSYNGTNWAASIEGGPSTAPAAAGFSYIDGAWKASIEGGVSTTPGAQGFTYTDGSWKASIEGGASATPGAEGFTYTDGSWKASIEGGASATPGAEGFTYTDGAWKASIEGGASATPGAEGFTYTDGAWKASIEGGVSATPGAEGFSYTDGAWKASIEGGASATPGAEGFTYTDGSWKASIEGGASATPGAEGFTYTDGAWKASIEGGASATPGAEGFTYTDGSWKASIEGGASATPGAEGFTYTDGSWKASIEGGASATPGAEGFTYTDGSWKASIEGGASATPGAAGFSYNGSNWVASIEGGASTTLNPVADGFTYDSTYNNGAGAWVATVEGNTTTTPGAEGFTYTDGSWKASIEGGTSTTNPADDGFTYDSTYNNGAGAWVAPIEGGSSTAPAAAGFTYNGSNWVASIEGGASTAPGAAGFSYNGSNWVASIEGGASTAPGAAGFTYTDGNWKASIEGGASATPGAEGFTYTDGSWKASIEGGSSTAPGAAGFTYNGSNWVASIEGSASTAPAAAGFSYNGSNWVAPIEGGSSTAPGAAGFNYNGSNWVAKIEGGASTAPGAAGFTYNGSDWVAPIEGGTSTNPAAAGYTYNSSGGFWEAEVENGVRTRSPAAEGYVYNGTNWGASVGGKFVTNPSNASYLYLDKGWHASKVDVGVGSEAIDDVTDVTEIDGFDQPDTALLNLESEKTEDSNGPSLFGKVQGLENLVGDVDQDGTADEAERITGIN